MAYTPDAEDTAQPTGNQALSTAALEFRTLKQYVQTTKTAQSAATALVASNLAAALVAQDSRDDAQDVYIAAAVAANAATQAELDSLESTLHNSFNLGTELYASAGSYTFVVPAGINQLIVTAAGGSTAGGYARSNYGGFGGVQGDYYLCPITAAPVTRSLAVVAGESISLVVGTGQTAAIVQTGQLATIEAVPQAGSTTLTGSLSSIVAPAARSFGVCAIVALGAGAAAASADAGKADGLLPVTSMGRTISNAYTENHLEAGAAGFIHIRY